MAAGIGTNPVEGRWGAAVLGYDQGNGSGAYQAGMWGGDPNIYANLIPLPNQKLERVANTSFIRRP